LGKPLPVYGDGLQVRDWLHVADHCEAISLALARGKSGEVYNIGGNSETTNIHIVRTLCALVDEYLAGRADLKAAFPASSAARGTHAAQLIEHVRDRPGHDRRYAIDYRKARRELGYEPTRDLAAGLRATLEWYLSNRAWWDALLGRDYAAWVEKNYTRSQPLR
jgi:dTDP-glucose 4,6-dehydratase